MKHENRPDRDTLYRLYVEEYTTAKCIGEMYGVTESAALDWLRICRIDRRSFQDAQMKGKIVPTDNQLYELYVVDMLPASTIGDKYGVSYGTVGRWLDKAGITRKTASEIQLRGKRRPDKIELRKLYVDDILGIPKIAEMFDCAEGTVYRWLVADGIDRRPPGVTRRGGKEKPDANELRRLYIDEQMTFGEIGEIFETNNVTARNWIVSENIKLRTPSEVIAVRTGGVGSGTKRGYCIKWTEELREHVRDAFGRKCFICDKTEKENGRKLAVHHTNSGKMCMCDYSCELVPLCISCHGMTCHNRFYWYSFIMCKLLLESSAGHMSIQVQI